MCRGPVATLHHRVPKSRAAEFPGLDLHDPENLVPVCQDCHEQYHNAMGNPSPRVWAREANARNLEKLCKRSQAFYRLAPEYVRKAHEDLAFGTLGGDR